VGLFTGGQRDNSGAHDHIAFTVSDLDTLTAWADHLDALGIAHEDGLIASEDLDAPPADKLADAARSLTTSFPAEDVALYLSTLVWQDPETWGALTEVPETRALARS
jgi:hypothetical protein